MTEESTHSGDGLVRYKEIHYVAETLHEYGLNFEKREIFLFGREEYGAACADGEPPVEPGVEYMMANQFIKNLRLLTSTTDDPILIHMKTCGGYWEEGMAIYQAIASCPNYVTVLNYTHARSMSSLIFLAADWRVMMPYSTYMIHRGTLGVSGTVTQAEAEFEQNRIAERQMLDIYANVLVSSPEFRGWTKSRIKGWLRRKMKDKEDVYFNADEAVRYNFADMIFGEDGTYDWQKLREGGWR